MTWILRQRFVFFFFFSGNAEWKCTEVRYAGVNMVNVMGKFDPAFSKRKAMELLIRLQKNLPILPILLL